VLNQLESFAETLCLILRCTLSLINLPPIILPFFFLLTSVERCVTQEKKDAIAAEEFFEAQDCKERLIELRAQHAEITAYYIQRKERSRQARVFVHGVGMGGAIATLVGERYRGNPLQEFYSVGVADLGCLPCFSFFCGLSWFRFFVCEFSIVELYRRFC
jgi:hypothetical protein